MSRPSILDSSAPADPANLIVRRRIRAGHEAEYERQLQQVLDLLESQPGHRGTGVLRPGEGGRDYTLIIRFESSVAAAAWEHSPQRAAWVAGIEPLIDGQVSLEKQPGLEFWFTPPAAEHLRQPPRWKMVVLTLLALYPLSLVLAALLALVAPAWPLPVRLLVQMVLALCLMTYLIMPLVTRLAGRWLGRT